MKSAHALVELMRLELRLLAEMKARGECLDDPNRALEALRFAMALCLFEDERERAAIRAME